jgi:hypothetical protein
MVAESKDIPLPHNYSDKENAKNHGIILLKGLNSKKNADPNKSGQHHNPAREIASSAEKAFSQ